MLRTKTFPAHFKADNETGTFEAVVAVFGNVDHDGDRIVEGAFANTLEEWKASGDPIPVIHSHQWYDINAHVGAVDPKDAVELAPGDARLPAELKDFGGLLVKGSIDINEDDPIAKKTHRLMVQRRLREFSFAYDIRPDGEKRGDDGVNELSDLDLFEVGPTLKGANPATVLVGAKSDALSIAAQLRKVVPVDLTAAIAKALEETEPETKARVSIGGSIESHLDDIAGEVRSWAGETFGDDLYWVYVEATLPDHVLAYVELWEEPIEGGTFYEIPYSVADNSIELGDPKAVALELSTVPKSFATLPRAKAVAADNPLSEAPAVDTDTDGDTDAGDVSLDDDDILSRVRSELSELEAVE